MSLQVIGKMSLKNQGGFVVKVAFVWWDEYGNKHQTGNTGSFPLGQSETADPGSLGVPNGSTVAMKALVTAGKDNQAQQQFTYQTGNPSIANYAISGTTLDNKLGLISIT
jgi:hypothetical protein